VTGSATVHSNGNGRRVRAGVRVLAEDPDLARWLSDPDGEKAAAELVTPVERVAPGPWHPWAHEQKRLGAMLVLDGLILHEVVVDGKRAVELLGPRDVVLTVPPGEAPSHNEQEVWMVLERARIAWLGRRFADAARRWPALWLGVFDRVEERARHATASLATVQMARVEDRLLTVLWDLAERWGRVTPEGVVLTAPLTHEVLGLLVGARRPSVTSALSGLRERGAVTRREDGAWVVARRPVLAGAA
jgi:CRP/FNR family cyclic AMP-dependent transcriptional regulator